MLSVPVSSHSLTSFLFFFNDTATTEIYTLSLHDALPLPPRLPAVRGVDRVPRARRAAPRRRARRAARPGVLGCDGPRRLAGRAAVGRLGPPGAAPRARRDRLSGQGAPRAAPLPGSIRP